MAINPLSANIGSLLAAEPLLNGPSIPPAPPGGGSFADIFSEAMDTASSTAAADKASTLALLAGQTDDLAGLLIDAQKAEIALSLALSLRNKVLEAYTEIMRMQV